MTPDYEKLGELIEDAEIALVTTVEADGTLHTRPLATLEYSNDGNLWFFTAIDSAKVDELAQDMRVSVAYANDDTHAYVAIAGTGEILRDREKAEELWTPLAKAWFPDGLDDPKLALLRVQIERAEYWTSPGKTAYVIGIAKAAMTGKSTNMGENRKLTM
jgi:general stress protein 26